MNIKKIKGSNLKLANYLYQILDQGLIDKLEHHPEMLDHSEAVEQVGISEKLSIFLDMESVISSSIKDKLFYPFYNKIFTYAKTVLKNSVYIEKILIVQVAESIADKLEWVYLRCLIQDMHQLKQQAQLKGRDSASEYDYYNVHFLSSVHHQKKLMMQYPIMFNRIIKNVHDTVEFVSEVMQNLKHDRDEIVSKLCRGIPFHKVKSMQINLSDEHISGKTVTKIILDNDKVIFYKPHCLRNLVTYNKVLKNLYHALGLEYYDYGVIERDGYGWEAQVQGKSCVQKVEIERYYRRMGIQLCVAYVMGISDLHFQNVIPHGEFPVFVDLEMFPDRTEHSGNDLKGLEKLLEYNVLSTGMLPAKIWNGNTNVSAFGQIEMQKMHYRVARINQQKTSNMHICYENPVLSTGCASQTEQQTLP